MSDSVELLLDMAVGVPLNVPAALSVNPAGIVLSAKELAPGNEVAKFSGVMATSSVYAPAAIEPAAAPISNSTGTFAIAEPCDGER